MGVRSFLNLKSALLLALAVSHSNAARILQSNDDGWAELYIRSLNDALNEAGHDVVLSAPAENKSGSSSLDVDPTARTDACEYDSCPANSGTTGTNATNTRLNWVNSYPVTATRIGISTLAPAVWGTGLAPELVVTGPNVGTNLWLQVPFSGTVGAATYAAQQGIPAIAFSGASEGNLAWNTAPVPLRSTLYAELATTLTAAVLASGAPYLPANSWLNVNFPEVEGACTTAGAFAWVLSRIDPQTPVLSTPDVATCGDDTLPTEHEVEGTDGCYISVSVGNAEDKTTATADVQAVVLEKLTSLLSCLP